MGFLSALAARDRAARIEGKDLYLRPPSMDDFAQWCALRQASADFLRPWEPTWQGDEFAAASFRLRIKHYRDLRSSDLGYPYFIYDSYSDALLGAATLHHVRRGAAQSATLGYWVGEAYARKSVMTRALAALLPFAHGELQLHRVEAACLPRNDASIRLLQKSGFVREGFAKAYIRIAGHWEDHILWSHMAT